jgi:excisionase family DNA binding protein
MMKTYTVREVAHILRLSESTIRLLLQARRLRHERHGRKYLIPEDAIEEYRTAVTVPATGGESKKVAPVARPQLKHLSLS